MANSFLVRVSDSVVDPSEAIAFVQDPAAGGSCVFVGTVRDLSEDGEVTGIVYEAWAELAERRLSLIAEEMLEDARKVALLHRVGDLTVGEVAVAVAASAPHREQAFTACRHGIERIKQDVPIWKKESLVSGEASWVMGS
jgi:molybdopterin synthase catalytic subunit